MITKTKIIDYKQPVASQTQ